MFPFPRYRTNLTPNCQPGRQHCVTAAIGHCVMLSQKLTRITLKKADFQEYYQLVDEKSKKADEGKRIGKHPYSLALPNASMLAPKLPRMTSGAAGTRQSGIAGVRSSTPEDDQ